MVCASTSRETVFVSSLFFFLMFPVRCRVSGTEKKRKRKGDDDEEEEEEVGWGRNCVFCGGGGREMMEDSLLRQHLANKQTAKEGNGNNNLRIKNKKKRYSTLLKGENSND